MTHYLCCIVQMYDGREFIFDEFLIETEEDIYKILEVKIQNITDDEDDWDWDGKWWSNYGESAYTIGPVKEVPANHVSVLSNYYSFERI